MQSKPEIEVKNNRSIINHQFVTSDATSIIAVYGHDNSRAVYIESGNKEKRTITKYQILLREGSYASDATSGWSVSTPSVSKETVIINGDQDYDIKQGLKALGRNIEFLTPSNGCVIL